MILKVYGFSPIYFLFFLKEIILWLRLVICGGGGLQTLIDGTSVLNAEVDNPCIKTMSSDLIATLSYSSMWEISDGTNGYARDPLSGFTIQWGTDTQTTDRLQNISFPLTFTKIFTVVCVSKTYKAMTGSQNNIGIYDDLYTSYFIRTIYDRYNGYNGTYWIALGLT